MTANSTAVATQQPMTAKALFGRDDVKAKFAEMLGKRSTSFITSVLQIVASNALLAKADPNSIYQAAAVAATLDLPINNNLGFAYIIPFNQKFKAPDGSWQTKTVAQFQLGYKGFIQLAQRSGQFKTLSATPIYEGQIKEENPLTGYVFDFTKKTSDKVVGYASFFELMNGFQKTLFMTTDQIRAHGGRYSQNFSNDKSLWKTDFDAMATKTVLKLLLSKFAPLNVEMQKAVISDQAEIRDAETLDVNYVDSVSEVAEEQTENKELQRIRVLIEDSKTIEDLEALSQDVPEELNELYTQRHKALSNASK